MTCSIKSKRWRNRDSNSRTSLFLTPLFWSKRRELFQYGHHVGNPDLTQRLPVDENFAKSESFHRDAVARFRRELDRLLPDVFASENDDALSGGFPLRFGQ